MNSSGITFVSTKKEKKRFLEFVYTLNEGENHFIPPLRMDQKKLIDQDKNPFFKNAEIALFLAEKDGKDVGRIAAIIDHRYNDYHGTKTGHFGFFDCIHDQHTANLLFRVASDWLKERGMEDMLGPSNPSMMDELGVLVDGFDKDPYVMMPWNKFYYDALIKNAGLEKAQDLLAYLISTETADIERMQRAADIVLKRNPGLRLRNVNLKKIDKEIKIIRNIFNEAWKNNWGFIPLSEAEFQAAADDLKMIVNPDFAYIVEDEGEAVAFSIGIPDINKVLKTMNGNLFPFGIFKLLWKKGKLSSLRTALMGVLPKYQGKGVDALMNNESVQTGLRYNDVITSEMSWVLESNKDMIRVAERLGGTLDKTYRMYSKKL
ncbi:MAG: hypothetical protein FH748_13015 [Balneolaceae bacterium]|nr:hypothetical protein [Balneolaceae bacterium]